MPSNAFQMVCVDLTAIVPWSHDHYHCMVVIVDHHSKYIITGPLRCKVAGEVAKWPMSSVILSYSMPKFVASDLRTELCRHVLDVLFAIMGIKDIHTTLYRPRSNAHVERNPQTTERIILKYTASNHKNWTDILPFATFAHNAPVSDTLQMACFLCCFYESDYAC